MSDPQPASPASPAGLADLAAGTRRQVDLLGVELAEIDLLVAQARSEAGRHEQRRVQAAEKSKAATDRGADAAELAELGRQLVAATRRAAVMEAQVDVLEGKQKVLGRFRDSLAGEAVVLERLAGGGGASGGAATGALGPASATEGEPGVLPAGVSRLLLSAQEDLRRDIARAMHDGPAQSLTNIVLQAQIVDRLLGRDAAAAAAELRQLVAMVQATLEATKSFIFDVRPMVLDDLGLVPTIRRAALERSRRARIPVAFESVGLDRRLPMDVESGLFRILDEATEAYLGLEPDRVLIDLDWSERLAARVRAVRDAAPQAEEPAAAGGASGRRRLRWGRGRDKEPEVPAALAAMIEERRSAEEAARTPAPIGLPAPAWRAIQQRAAVISVSVELADEGHELRVGFEPGRA